LHRHPVYSFLGQFCSTSPGTFRKPGFLPAVANPAEDIHGFLACRTGGKGEPSRVSRREGWLLAEFYDGIKDLCDLNHNGSGLPSPDLEQGGSLFPKNLIFSLAMLKNINYCRR
jgi:hypothetical protein